ncbi:MAG: hypothetical protein M3680_29435 [Myxococcota bacterium]|nr:hypothetical protein [Myxococcota bacterium]
MAALTGLWLVTCGFLSARHEAEVPHVRDRAGQVFHGVLSSNPAGADADERLHARDSAFHEHRACPLSASLHQPGPVHHTAIVNQLAEVGLVLVVPPDRADGRQRYVYRLAPKTSPPLT